MNASSLPHAKLMQAIEARRPGSTRAAAGIGGGDSMTLTVTKDDHVRGSGPVTILVYGDYECPYTRALELVIAQLRDRNGDSFRYVYRYFPLREIHPHAEMAAEAAEAVFALAGPDAFWVMHDALFANQYDLEPDSL